MKVLHKKHFDTLAQYIHEEFKRRKEKRKGLEKQWLDIDRQLRMEPDRRHKLDANGKEDKDKAWMPEMELPLQAEALEILNADARRLREPPSGAWFSAHALMTDRYLDQVDFSSLVSGDENDVPSKLNQDNVDKLVIGTMMHWQRQYNFHDHIDMIDAEAFKYGLGVGRARLVTKDIFMHTAKGVVKQSQRIPVLFPTSIKNNYPDDRAHIMMNEGLMMGPLDISFKTQLLEDVKAAATKGVKDPAKENGGWMTAPFKNLKGKKDGTVDVIEAEGDFIIPRSADTIVLRNYIVTVVIGEANPTIVRARRRQTAYSTTIYFPYHIEHLDTPYATSPLMKGRPIQIAAVDALNRLGMVAALNSQPPLKYDKDITEFSSSGPKVHPGALWPDANVSSEQIGDVAAMQALYVAYIRQYEDVTGVSSPRLGAQTKSHTTAFAKDAELTRGTIRTVDYSRSSLNGPLAKWLMIAYDMGRETMKADTIYIDEYKSFVDLKKIHLPEKVVFEAFGAGTPTEEQVKDQRRMSSLSFAMQIDQLKMQLQQEPSLDLTAVQEQILQQGGWIDIDVFLRAEAVSGIAESGPQVGATPGFVTAPPTEI